MNNTKSVLENEMDKLLWDFDANRSPNLGQTTRPSDRQQKRTYRIVDFAVIADPRVKLKKSEKKDKYQDAARELKKSMEHEHNSDTNCGWYTWDNP